MKPTYRESSAAISLLAAATLMLGLLAFAEAEAARLLNPSPPLPRAARPKAAALNAYATSVANQQFVMVVQGTKDWDGAGNDYVVVQASATYYDLSTGTDLSTQALGSTGIVKVPVGSTQQINISAILPAPAPGPGQGRIVNATVFGPVSNYQLASDFMDELGKSWVIATAAQQATLYPTFVSITVASVASTSAGAHINGGLLLRASRQLAASEAIVVLVSAPQVGGMPVISKLVPTVAGPGGLTFTASYAIDLPPAYTQAFAAQVGDKRLMLNAEAQLSVNGGAPQSFSGAASRAQAAISLANTLACTASSNPSPAVVGKPVTLTASCHGNYNKLGYTWTDGSGATIGTGASITIVAQATQNYTISISDPTAGPFAPTYTLQVFVQTSTPAQQLISPALTTAVNAPTIQMRNVRRQLDDLRAQHSPASAQALSVSYGGQSLPPLSAFALDAGAKDGKPQRGGGASAEEPDAFEHWGVFVNGDLDIGRQSAVDTQSGFKVTTQGLTGGVDYRFVGNHVLGVALGWLKADTDLSDGASTQNASGFAASLFGSYIPAENAYIDGILNFGHNSYDSQRAQTAGGFAYSSTGGDQFGLSLSAGYNLYRAALTLNGHGRVEYVDARVSGFTEGGAAQEALTIGDQKVKQTTLALGGQASYAISTPWGVLIPNAQVEWLYLAQNDVHGVTTQFAAIPGSTTVVTVPAQNRSYGNGAAGVQALFGPRVTGFFNYQASFGRGSYRDQQYTVGIRMEF